MKAAIVTGASSGIGEAAAVALAQAGFKVAIAARRPDALERVAARIAAAGGEAAVIPCDLGRDGAAAALAREAIDRLGPVDVLVNNAGFSPPGALEQVSHADLRATFEVNVVSALALTAALVPHMRARRSGRIIGVGSLAASVPAPLAAPYAATKAAMAAAMECLRLELGPFGIEVIMIVPGFVDTPIFDKTRTAAGALRADPDNPYRRAMFALDAFARKQLERPLSPDDVASAIVTAATAPRPRATRYLPRSAGVIATLRQLMPARVLDRMLLRHYGLA